MSQEYDISGMSDKVSALRRDAEELRNMAKGIPTVDCNVNRILACVRMLEININDAWEVLGN